MSSVISIALVSSTSSKIASVRVYPIKFCQAGRIQAGFEIPARHASKGILTAIVGLDEVELLVDDSAEVIDDCVPAAGAVNSSSQMPRSRFFVVTLYMSDPSVHAVRSISYQQWL